MPRKKWRTVYPGSRTTDPFASELKAYEFVDALRSAWAAGADNATGSLTVQVDEVQGWQPHEHINFAEEGQ
jgi:hypothetical protein